MTMEYDMGDEQFETTSRGNQQQHLGTEKVGKHKEMSNPTKGGESPELKLCEKKALLQFRCKLQDAILGNYLLAQNKAEDCRLEYEFNEVNCKAREDLREIHLWGVPLLPSKDHEGTNIILLKFLQARDYKVQDAYEMLRKMLNWRRDFKIEDVLNEKFSSDLNKVAHFDSTDKEGHPLCYLYYGAFQDKDLFLKTFGTPEKCQDFLRWRIKVMEDGVRRLCVGNGGSDSIVEIIDLKNLQNNTTKDLRTTSKKALLLFQENYPEFIVKHIYVNVPMWYYAYHTVISRIFSQRTKSKFVFAHPSRVPKTLLKFVAPEYLPVHYGGFKRDNDDEFTPEDKVSELILKGGDTQNIKIPVSKPEVTVVWDVMVIGPDVTYKEEFVPDDEGSYRILLQKENKVTTTVRNSFYINEPGMILLSVDNKTFKKKKILYRIKIKPTVPMYIYLK